MIFGRPRPAARAILVAGAVLFLAPPLVFFPRVPSLDGPALHAQEAGVDDPATLPRFESLGLVEHPDGVELEVMASGPLQWSIHDPGDGELIVRLRDCRPGVELPALRPLEGLVESVDVGAFGTLEHPETRVSIRTRQAVKYRVAAGERSVAVLLISRDRPAAEGRAEPALMAEPSPIERPPVEPPPVERPAAEPLPVEPPLPAVDVVPPAEAPAEPSTAPIFEPARAQPPAAGAGQYLVGAGDVLAIDVFGLDEMDRRVRVQRDGKISLPLLGAFTVAGLDLEAAERLIAGMLKDKRLVREAQVSIFVEELVSRAINVQGAVVRPGVYQLIGSKTLLELIGEAGGIREDSGARVLVLRQEAGQERKMDLDLEALIAGEDRSLNIPLLPGDIVMVPFSRQLTVYVTGAVGQPGPVSYRSSEGITVLQAITTAGGPTPRANLKNVHVLRKSTDGGQQRIPVNVKRVQNGKMDDLALERNDTVVVGEWFF